jgi:hypothetical protein
MLCLLHPSLLQIQVVFAFVINDMRAKDLWLIK